MPQFLNDKHVCMLCNVDLSEPVALFGAELTNAMHAIAHTRMAIDTLTATLGAVLDNPLDAETTKRARAVLAMYTKEGPSNGSR